MFSRLFGSVFKPRERYSVESLKYYHAQLVRNPVMNERNRDLIIETLRSLAELLVWGDQNCPAIFDYFLGNNMLSEFYAILNQRASPLVPVQLLQTLSIVVENTQSVEHLYVLLSNNRINAIITHEHDFSNEDLLAHFVSFLKAISLRLSPATLEFFFNAADRDFPLYTEAVKFFSHSEPMVVIAVRTVTLNIYRIENEAMRAFVLDARSVPYLSNLVHFIARQAAALDELVVTAEGRAAAERLDSLVESLLDQLFYVHDIFDLKIDSVNAALTGHLMDGLVRPVLLASLTASETRRADVSGGPASVRPPVALFLLAQLFFLFTWPPLLNAIARELLDPAADGSPAPGVLALYAALAATHGDSLALPALLLLNALYRNRAIDPAVLFRARLGTARVIRAQLIVGALTADVSEPTRDGDGDDAASNDGSFLTAVTSATATTVATASVAGAEHSGMDSPRAAVSTPTNAAASHRRTRSQTPQVVPVPSDYNPLARVQPLRHISGTVARDEPRAAATGARVGDIRDGTVAAVPFVGAGATAGATAAAGDAAVARSSSEAELALEATDTDAGADAGAGAGAVAAEAAAPAAAAAAAAAPAADEAEAATPAEVAAPAATEVAAPAATEVAAPAATEAAAPAAAEAAAPAAAAAEAATPAAAAAEAATPAAAEAATEAAAEAAAEAEAGPMPALEPAPDASAHAAPVATPASETTAQAAPAPAPTPALAPDVQAAPEPARDDVPSLAGAGAFVDPGTLAPGSPSWRLDAERPGDTLALPMPADADDIDSRGASDADSDRGAVSEFTDAPDRLAIFGGSAPAAQLIECTSTGYAHELTFRLLCVLHHPTRVRLTALQLCAELLLELVDQPRSAPAGAALTLTPAHQTVLQMGYVLAAERLRASTASMPRHLLISFFEDEYLSAKTPVRFERLMQDPSALLPVAQTALSGLSFDRRLACGDSECARRAMQTVLLLRHLRRLLLARDDDGLSWLDSPPRCELDSTLDLTGAQLLECLLMADGTRVAKRYMVIRSAPDDGALVLVERHPTERAAGIVRFSGSLENVEIAVDSRDACVLHLEGQPLARPLRKRKWRLDLTFESPSFCLAARDALDAGAWALMDAKLAGIAQLVGFARNAFNGPRAARAYSPAGVVASPAAP